MRRRNRVLAFILAVIIALSNLPPVQRSAAAAGEGPTGMRLRQTGFNEETGILTMTLEIKPSVLGQVTEGANGRNTYSGHFIDEAYLAFQVDTLSVEPVTVDGTPIDAGYGHIGFVGPTRQQIDDYSESSSTASLVAVWKNFVHNRVGMGEQFGQGFNSSMGTGSTFSENVSGYFTSNNRGATGFMDCYLHLRWDSSWRTFEEAVDSDGNPLNDGYVKAIDLYFQCYSGSTDSSGQQAKATSTDALFCNSIVLPSGVQTDSSFASSGMSKEEMQELINQFYVFKPAYVGEDFADPEVEGSATQMYLSTGVAGFRERSSNALGTLSQTDVWHYYAYDVQPRDTEFNAQSGQKLTENSLAMDSNPEISYDHMDKKYIVLSFDALLDNTYEHGAENTGGSDFYIPTDKGDYPRYAIPYLADMEEMEDKESRQGIWVPKAQFQEDEYVPLKYHLTTYVSGSSTTKPEDEGGLDEFLKRLTWKFALRETDGANPIPLDNYYSTLRYTDPLGELAGETEAETVTLRSDYYDHVFEVRQAYIGDPSSNYYGCKVQTVREITDGLDDAGEVHVTPVGVMFDFTDKTDVTYMTITKDHTLEKTEPTKGYAPQLRISSQAANDRSYLWLSTLGTAGGVAARQGEIYIMVDYADAAGGTYSTDLPIQVKIYRDDVRNAARTMLTLDESYRDPGEEKEEEEPVDPAPEQPEEETDENAYLIDVAKDGPQLALAGIRLNTAVYDQYGDLLLDSNGHPAAPTIEIVPSEKTQEAISANRWGVNALDTRYDEDNFVYYLIYGKNQLYGANDLVAGEYELRAVYPGVTEEQTAVANLRVTKDPNKFSYLDSDIRLTSDTITTPQGLLYSEGTVTENGEEIQEIRLRVPPKVLASADSDEFMPQVVSAEFNLMELANQWRDPDSGIQTPGEPFDVLPGLRDEDGNLSLEKIREYFDFSFEWTNADGTAVEPTGVDATSTNLKGSGRFVYTSEAGFGTHPDTRNGAKDAVEGDPMYVTVKVSRLDENQEPISDEVQINKYRIYFVRDNRSLTTIKGSYKDSTPGKEVTATLFVPEENQPSLNEHIIFAPYDQYDENLNWSTLEANDGLEWEMKIDPSSLRDENGNKLSSLTGVTIGGLNSSYVQVTNEAQPCSFDVYAVYGGMDTSKPETNNQLTQLVHIKVAKNPSVPTRIKSITSDIIEIPVPNIDEVNAAIARGETSAINKGGPKIVVVDQYGAEMDPDSYIMRWSFSEMSPDPKISLEPSTGVVSVRSIARKDTTAAGDDDEEEPKDEEYIYECAPAWENITMTVRLYSKVESPVGSGHYVQGEWMNNITVNTTYTGLRVVRNAVPSVDELVITTESLEYPAMKSASRADALEAYATTEYGVGTPLVAGDGSMWILESVEYGDGTKAVYRNPVTDAEGNQLVDEDGQPRWIPQDPPQVQYESGGSTWYDIARRVITVERDGAQMQFGNSVTNIDWAPVAITVTSQYSDATTTKRIPITYGGAEFSDIVRQPSSVTIVDRVSQVIQVPKSNEPDVEVQLDAVVQDQFGFIIYGDGAANAPCTWEIVDPQTGVSIKNGTTLVVDSYAGNGSVTVRATYTDPETGATIKAEQPIGLGLAPSEPSLLIPQGIEELPDVGNMEDAVLPMPGFTGPAKNSAGKALNNSEQNTYTLKAKVEDGNHVHLTAQTVIWSVAENAYGIASISNNNKLTIHCTQDWIDAGRPETVQIKLHARDSSSIDDKVSADVILTVYKQQDFGMYALPEMTKAPGAPSDKSPDGTWPVWTDRVGLEKTHLLVPSMEDYEENGSQPYEVPFVATVYSQYREELPGWPVEISYRNPTTMASEITGLSWGSAADDFYVTTGERTLYVSPNVDVNMAHLLVVAKPNGNNAVLDTAVNKCDVYFDFGASYQAGVALGTDYFSPVGDLIEDVPAWDPGDDQNIPVLDDLYTEFELHAFVHDQRGSDYEGFNVEGVYPVWKLGDNVPEGVTVENPTDNYSHLNDFDADGNPYGKTLHVWVSNKALLQNETEKNITVHVWANGHLEEGGDFVKTQKITLVKAPSRATYMYFRNVESTDPEDGVGVAEGIRRPGIADPAVTVPVGAVVFDSYGYEMNNVATTISVRESTLPDGVTVEPIYDGTDGADEESRKVVGQKIMRGDLVMVEFTAPVRGLGNGSMKVYTACNLDMFELELQCTQVPGTKILRLPIIQEEKYAASAALYDSDTNEPIKDANVIFRSLSEEHITKSYYVAIFDQYGDFISEELSQTITPVWTLNTPGEEEGVWVEYTETDEDGNPLPDDERFVRYREVEETKGFIMVVNPSKYKSPVQLSLGCVLLTEDGELLPISIPNLEFMVRRRANSAASADGAYIVTYYPGLHGKLNGTIETETVLEGTSPKLVPDVLADKGYAHRGWDMYGELVDDPGTLQVYNDIELVAQYIKLSDIAFVSGYEDNTVHPLSDITRGEFTRMLVGALTNYDPATHAKYANPFEDVGENRYYRDYIAYAYFYGIVSGYEDGTFRPDDSISRAEAAAMIAKARNISKVPGVTVFKDLDPQSWYAGFVEALGRLEVLHGYGDGTFRPSNHLTRAEAVTMLVRISDTAPTERELEALRRVAEIPFKDLDRKYWATPYILRAAGIA